MQWTQFDPVSRFTAEASGVSPHLGGAYRFSANNPLRYYDPDGRWTWRQAFDVAVYLTALPSGEPLSVVDLVHGDVNKAIDDSNPPPDGMLETELRRETVKRLKNRLALK
jgi:hypothetical protein